MVKEILIGSDTITIRHSLPISSPYDADLLTVFHFDGANWTPLPNVYDLNTDGSYANFTASADGEYAIVVPEPTWLVFMVCSVLLLRRYRGAFPAG